MAIYLGELMLTEDLELYVYENGITLADVIPFMIMRM